MPKQIEQIRNLELELATYKNPASRVYITNVETQGFAYDGWAAIIAIISMFVLIEIFLIELVVVPKISNVIKKI